METQIISIYTEAFYNCFNRNHKLSTFIIFIRIVVPASPNIIGCRTMRVLHCSLRCLNISDIIPADIKMRSVISYNKHNEYKIGEAERYLKGLWVSTTSTTYFYSSTALTWMKILGTSAQIVINFINCKYPYNHAHNHPIIKETIGGSSTETIGIRAVAVVIFCKFNFK